MNFLNHISRSCLITVSAVVSGLIFVGCSNVATDFDLPMTQDSFTGQVFYNNKVDVLFVVDNSKSMLQYQRKLSSQVQSMVSTLNALKMDYRVAVTTSTMSSDTAAYPLSRKLVGQPFYLTAKNIHLLAERIIVGESGSDLERSLDAMAHVISTSYLNSVSSDFVRGDALLSIIFISDEKDMSSEYGKPDSKDFVKILDARKPRFDTGSRGWLANYIGILSNQSCDILGGSVSIGTQFLTLVEESRGVKSSICNPDLSLAVSNIKARIIDQVTAYWFRAEPNKSTIIVTIGGRAIFEDAANGWTLESETILGEPKYFLRFHGTSIPAADETVDVVFKNAGAA